MRLLKKVGLFLHRKRLLRGLVKASRYDVSKEPPQDVFAVFAMRNKKQWVIMSPTTEWGRHRGLSSISSLYATNSIIQEHECQILFIIYMTFNLL